MARYYNSDISKRQSLRKKEFALGISFTLRGIGR
jgi:hypothetical protein